jgi:NitT/TauT family transport system permease protein
MRRGITKRLWVPRFGTSGIIELEACLRDDLALVSETLPPRASTWTQAVRRWLPPLAIVLVLAILWEVAKASLAIPDNKLPHLTAVLGEFGQPTRGGTGPIWAVLMAQNAWATLQVALLGFAIGGVLGCLLAVAFAGSALLSRGCLPFVVGSQLVPLLAIAPMVVIGVGRTGAPDWLAKSLIAAYLTFFPVTVGMLRGLTSVPADAQALMRSYAATRWQTFWKLSLPSALPFLFTSLKLAATASVVGAIVGELPSGSATGLGPVIINASQYYNSRPQNLWAAVLVSSLVGLLFFAAVSLAEQIVVRKPAGEHGG